MRIQVDASLSLAADVYGDYGSPTVVFFHGGGQTRHSWDRSARLLGQSGWRAMTVDLRGHGDSDWSSDGDYSLARFADDIRGLVEVLNTRPALVGASLGGLSSLLAIGEADHDLASGLVLVDIALEMEPVGVARVRAFMSQGLNGFADLDEAASAIASYNPNRRRPADLSGLKKNLRLREDGRWYWHWDPKLIGDEPDDPGLDGLPSRQMVDMGRLGAAASNVRVPTLVVRGSASDLLSERGAAALRTYIPQATVVEVPGAGHMVAGDRNDLFNSAVIAFLEREVRPAQQSTLPQA